MGRLTRRVPLKLTWAPDARWDFECWKGPGDSSATHLSELKAQLIRWVTAVAGRFDSRRLHQ